MQGLGSRIRQLRREQKLTLEQLAGDRLTKGMLSLIENGKAQPSMESLHHIAQQLKVDVSSLLGEEVESFRELMLEVEELRHLIMSDDPDHKRNAQKIIDKVTPILHKLQTNRYEHIRIKEIYLKAVAIATEIVDKHAFYHIVDCYEDIHAYSSLLNCYSFLCWRAYDQGNLEQALEFLLQAEKRVRPYWLIISDISQINLFYNLMFMYYAVSDGENGALYKEKLLKVAHEKKIYYKMDDFYRLLFGQAISEYRFEESMVYFKKLHLITKVMEEDEIVFFYLFCRAHYLNTVEKNYEQVIHFLRKDVYTRKGKFLELMRDMYKTEESIALYHLEKYEEALAVCENIKISERCKHRLELCTFYRFVAYRARMYERKGDHESAVRDIIYAFDSVKAYPNNFYTDFIRTTYKQIMK